MGGAKEQAMRMEDHRQLAIDIAIEAGVLTRCEGHDYVLDSGGGSPEDAYRLANALISKGDPRVIEFKDQRRALTDLIQSVIADHGSECPGCEAAQRD